MRQRGSARGPGDGRAIQAFAAALRGIKARTGKSYRALAPKAMLSPAALHRYCVGKSVPHDFLIVLRFARAAAVDRREEAHLHQLWLQARSATEGTAGIEHRPGVPAQLPIDVRGFIGREVELGKLTDLIGTTQRPPLVLITGMAGVGKTALALRWAHSMAAQFPDGQIYVNLRGFDPSRAPMDPNEAISALMSAFAVELDQAPPGLDARAALYRSLLAAKRALLILDNAADADQVRPLLPGSASCLTIVTSRNQMPGLIAIEGAFPISLDIFQRTDALRLLSQRLGGDRIAAHPNAADEVITLCARLPLALSIVAAQATIRRSVPLELLAAELREARHSLDPFTDTDSAADLRSVFASSYHALSPSAARLFRLLGLHPGPDLSAEVVASLAGVSRPAAHSLLFELLRAHLVSEHIAGRFSLHDLLRIYAAELAAAHPDVDEPHAALTRLLDHYLHTAHAAALLLQPLREPIELGAVHLGVIPEVLTDHVEARQWFLEEHPVLVALVGQAAEAGMHAHSWRIAWSVANFLDRTGRWHDLLATQRAAVAATELLDDKAGQMHAHRLLGRANLRLDRLDEADQHLNRALTIAAAASDIAGQAHIHMTLGRIHSLQRRISDGRQHALMTLDLYRRAGNTTGQAYALNNVGWFHGQLGEHAQGLDYCEQSLALQRELDDRHGEAAALCSIGFLKHHLGRYPEAILCFHQANAIFREFDDRYSEADALIQLGDTHIAANDCPAAIDAWQQALDILEGLNHPDAEKARAKLEGLRIP